MESMSEIKTNPRKSAQSGDSRTQSKSAESPNVITVDELWSKLQAPKTPLRGDRAKLDELKAGFLEKEKQFKETLNLFERYYKESMKSPSFNKSIVPSSNAEKASDEYLKKFIESEKQLERERRELWKFLEESLEGSDMKDLQEGGKYKERE